MCVPSSYAVQLWTVPRKDAQKVPSMRNMSSLDADSASVLILDFAAFRTMGNTFLLFIN